VAEDLWAAPKDWPRQIVIALSLPLCTRCRGLGHIYLTGGGLRPCKCVLRAVFRRCYHWWYSGKTMCMRTNWRMRGPRQGSRLGWSVPGIEFSVDFERVAWLALRKRRPSYPHIAELFRLHYLEGWDWRQCCLRLRMSKGDFFHAAYIAEEAVGRACRELRPYSLYPVEDYMYPRRER
jgi:hypothetical protein